MKNGVNLGFTMSSPTRKSHAKRQIFELCEHQLIDKHKFGYKMIRNRLVGSTDIHQSIVVRDQSIVKLELCIVRNRFKSSTNAHQSIVIRTNRLLFIGSSTMGFVINWQVQSIASTKSTNN